jgi:hypothetical protein
MKSFRCATFALVFALVGGTVMLGSFLARAVRAQAPAGGQPQGRAGQPAAPQNLQVLPKDIPRPELLATMRGFANALGVGCEHCHVEEPARDFASDAKQPKKTARVMLQMVVHINEMLATGLGKAPADITKVQCVTCHRGEAIPKVEAAAAGQQPRQ